MPLAVSDGFPPLCLPSLKLHWMAHSSSDSHSKGNLKSLQLPLASNYQHLEIHPLNNVASSTLHCSILNNEFVPSFISLHKRMYSGQIWSVDGNGDSGSYRCRITHSTCIVGCYLRQKHTCRLIKALPVMQTAEMWRQCTNLSNSPCCFFLGYSNPSASVLYPE